MTSKKFVMNCSVSSRIAPKIVFAINSLGVGVYFEKEARTVNAGSILGLLSLNINAGDEINILVNGKDKEQDNFILSQIEKILE